MKSAKLFRKKFVLFFVPWPVDFEGPEKVRGKLSIPKDCYYYETYYIYFANIIDGKRKIYLHSNGVGKKKYYCRGKVCTITEARKITKKPIKYIENVARPDKKVLVFQGDVFHLEKGAEFKLLKN